MISLKCTFFTSEHIFKTEHIKKTFNKVSLTFSNLTFSMVIIFLLCFWCFFFFHFKMKHFFSWPLRYTNVFGGIFSSLRCFTPPVIWYAVDAYIIKTNGENQSQILVKITCKCIFFVALSLQQMAASSNESDKDREITYILMECGRTWSYNVVKLLQ